MELAMTTQSAAGSDINNHHCSHIDERGLPNAFSIQDNSNTRCDQLDMHRLGRRQELVRIFRPLSVLSLGVLIQATWECLLLANTQALVDGGTAGFVWSYMWTFIGFGIVTLSLAEMASMAPTSGGQYHWVSEFAPPAHQNVLSYITGWLSTLSWQAGAAASSYLSGTIIQALITLNNPNYNPKSWQGTLLTFAMALFILAVSIWGARAVPTIQNILLIVHVFSFFTIVFVIWFLAPLNSAEIVFTRFRNNGGWQNMGVSLMAAQISAVYSLICSDAAAHMAEEVKNAGLNVPKAMISSYLLNGSLGFVFVVTYAFALTDSDAAISDPTGYPFIWVFREAASLPGVNFLTVLILILNIASTASYNASTSRQTFAFARDNGLPAWIGTVHPNLHVPRNSIIVTCIITCLLSLISIGSYTAFNAFISMQISSLMFSYSISISCVLYRRILHPNLLPPARWSLGRAGVLLNALGVAYSVFIFFWSFWPVYNSFVTEELNWSSVIFVGVCVVCAGMYFIHGRYHYISPVTRVEENRSRRQV